MHRPWGKANTFWGKGNTLDEKPELPHLAYYKLNDP